MAGEWTGTRTHLFEEMTAAAGVPNVSVLASYLREGAPVFGEVPRSGLYEADESVPGNTFLQVIQAGKWANPQIRATVRPNLEPLVDEEVTKRTRE